MATIEIDGERLYYNEKGRGTPVVFVHGFPLDSRIWDAQVAGLSDKCRVIAPDLRGFGKSERVRPFSIEDLAADLHHLLQKINALPCVLGGLSMGGYVSFAYVTKFPADLKGLMLIATKAEADTAEGKANRMKMIESCRVGGAKVVADAMAPKMTAPNASPDVVAQARRIMEQCPPATIENACLAMRDRRDYTGDLPSIAVPTLIVIGDQDAFIPLALAQRTRDQIPHAQITVIPNAGHLAPMEQPRQTNEAIRRFIETL
jgi:pimeloyl-ACP methyl ester carboxylesterase